MLASAGEAATSCRHADITYWRSTL